MPAVRMMPYTPTLIQKAPNVPKAVAPRVLRRKISSTATISCVGAVGLQAGAENQFLSMKYVLAPVADQLAAVAQPEFEPEPPHAPPPSPPLLLLSHHRKSSKEDSKGECQKLKKEGSKHD